MKINNEIKHEYPWKPSVIWRNRTFTIARIIRDWHKNKHVIDLGGGMGNLYRVLKQFGNWNYLSIDNKPWTDLTVVNDFNAGEFPNLRPKLYEDETVLVAAGILEYIKEPLAFIFEIKKYSKDLIITYRIGEKREVERNHLTFELVENVLKTCGWRILETRAIMFRDNEPVEKLYRCTKIKL